MKKILLVLVAMFSFLLLNDRVFAFDFTNYDFSTFQEFENLIADNLWVVNPQAPKEEPIKLRTSIHYGIFHALPENNHTLCIISDAGNEESKLSFLNNKELECFISKDTPLYIRQFNNLGEVYYKVVDENGDQSFSDTQIYHLRSHSLVTDDGKHIYIEKVTSEGLDPLATAQLTSLFDWDIISDHDILDYDTKEVFESSSKFDNYTQVELEPGESVALIPKEPFEEDYDFYAYNFEDLIYGFYDIDSAEIITKLEIFNNTYQGSKNLTYPANLSKRNTYMLLYNNLDHATHFWFDATEFNYVVFDSYGTDGMVGDIILSNPNDQMNLQIKQEGLEESLESSGGGFDSLMDILMFIPNLIILFSSVITTIFGLITLFFNSMPTFMSISLQALFFIGIIILLIKLLRG